MVARSAFFISVALLLAGQAHAAPFFVKTSVTARSAAPLDSITTFGRRIPSEIAVRAVDGVIVPYSKREEEELSRRQDSVPVPGGNLDLVNPDDVSEDVAAQSTDGIVSTYRKRGGYLFGRQDNSTSSTNITVTIDNSPPPPPPGGNLNKNNPQNVPEEAPATSTDGTVVPYRKREGHLFGRQNNSTSPSSNVTVTIDNSPPPPPPQGNLNQKNPQNVPEEAAAAAPDSVVIPFAKRQWTGAKARRFISSEIPTRSLDGEIEFY